MTGKLIISCPEMAVHHVSYGHSITDKLIADWKFRRVDEKVFTGQIIFPPTPVSVDNPEIPFWWTVANCTAASELDAENVIFSYLPAEPCTFKLGFNPHTGRFGAVMIAEKIIGQTTLSLADGTIWEGPVIYPQVPAYHTAPGTFTVDACQASGILTQKA